MAIPSSYALVYDFPTGEFFSNQAGAPPYGNRTLVTDPAGLFDNPYRDVGGEPHPIVTGPDTSFPVGGTFASMDHDINAPRIQSWNVSFERQFGSDWGASVAYLGSYSDRLWGLVENNPGVFLGTGLCTLNGVSIAACTTTANLNQRRVTLSGETPASATLISNLENHTAVGTQTYRGLKLSVQRRYTWSRCFGLEMPTGAEFGIGFVNPADPDHDRGHCEQNRTHLANVTVGYQTPAFGNATLRTIASNWRVSGILNARSGPWMSILSGRDDAFNGMANQRVDQVSNDVYGAKH